MIHAECQETCWMNTSNVHAATLVYTTWQCQRREIDLWRLKKGTVLLCRIMWAYVTLDPFQLWMGFILLSYYIILLEDPAFVTENIPEWMKINVDMFSESAVGFSDKFCFPWHFNFLTPVFSQVKVWLNNCLSWHEPVSQLYSIFVIFVAQVSTCAVNCYSCLL